MKGIYSMRFFFIVSHKNIHKDMKGVSIPLVHVICSQSWHFSSASSEDITGRKYMINAAGGRFLHFSIKR